MPVKQCTLNGRTIRSLQDFYDQLAAGFSLPENFGRNLDALWDVLSTDVEGPFKIVWEHSGDSKKLLGKDFDRVVTLLKDLQKERMDFTLKIEK